MTSQSKPSFFARIDLAILRIHDWVYEDEQRAIIAALSATSATLFIWGLCLMLKMPLPDVQ